jgi:hypothetical protein|tara:strand:- start:680 stop:979 length:300 start_codon:yes stop_codon:yes gene_type:complete
MKNSGLNTLVLILIIITLVLLSTIVLIDSFEKERKHYGNSKITGKMYKVGINHYGTGDNHYKHVKTTKRYDDKLFDHLENMHKSRDNTFMKGKVFLKER